MLSCKEITELVTDYLEGRLSLWQRLRFRLHVGMCRHCLAYLRQMRTTIRMLEMLGHVAQEAAPQAVPEELLRRFRNWRK